MADSDVVRFQRASQAYEAGRYAEAQDALHDFARLYPSNANVQSAEGMLLVESGRIDAGLPFLAQAHRLNPRGDAVAANLGLAYLKTGKTSKAIAPLQTARRLAPRSFVDRLALAEALFSAHHYAEAAATYSKAAALPHNTEEMPSAELHSQWALALINAGDPSEATVILRSDPLLEQNASLQEMFGEAEEKSGHFQNALIAFKRAAELDPTESSIGAYGEELLRHWTFSAATEIYQYGVSRYPASERMKSGLGTAHFGNNNFPAAAAIVEDLLRNDPEDAGVADMLGRSCSAEVAGEIPSCDGLIEFAQKHPANTSAGLYAGIALITRPKAEARENDAEVLLQPAIKADPKLADAWYQLGGLQQSRGDWNGSIGSLQRAIALRPAYPQAHYRLARAYARNGCREDSQQEIALQQKYAQEGKDADNQRMNMSSRLSRTVIEGFLIR